MTKSALAIVVSLLIAAGSIGFAVGQAVGPGEASGARAARVIPVRDSAAYNQLWRIRSNLWYICRALVTDPTDCPL
jgi:hypothetical protein